jgi:biopolymer transport protein ExbD
MGGGGGMPEEGGSGKKKKKSLDAVINVVPAIDLLSCCITFLLYTAVWTQISRLQVQQLGTGAPEPAVAEQQQKTLLVTLAVGERGYNLSTSAGTSIDIPTLGRDPEGKIRFDMKSLTEQLKRLKGDYPDTSAITVQAEDTISYGDLVQVIDTAMGAGLVSVSVSGV